MKHFDRQMCCEAYTDQFQPDQYQADLSHMLCPSQAGQRKQCAKVVEKALFNSNIEHGQLC